MKPFDTYPGSKDAAGVAERIISLMPAHEVYVELFVGGGAVYRKKAPARASILVDLDPSVVIEWRSVLDTLDDDAAGVLVMLADATSPDTWPEPLALAMEDPDAVCYMDPPYLRSTRTRSIYGCELETEEDHRRLLTVAKSLPCKVLISGYWSKLYDEELREWHKTSFTAGTRGGKRTEWVWTNYDPSRIGCDPAPVQPSLLDPPTAVPIALHDVRFVGKGYRERERIKRRVARWLKAFEAMAPNERQAIREAIGAKRA